MGQSDELRTLRSRVADLQGIMDRVNRDRPDEQAAMTGRVFDDGAMPSSVPAFFAVHPVDLGGAEVEGGAITFAESTGVVYFLVLGPDVPEVGDVLFADSCGGRWVAEHQADEEAPPEVDLGCGCPTVPTTIYMKATNPLLNNQLFQDATLVYGPPPAPFVGFPIPDPAHWSPGTFVDGSGNTFYYAFYCDTSVYRLDLAYTTGPGAPVLSNRYTWNPGVVTGGNACNGFYMLNGTVFVGGNATNKNYLSGTLGDWAIGEFLLNGQTRTSGFVAVPGVTVTCDGVSAVSNANGDFSFKIPQSASTRGWTATKSGWSPASGSVAGQTPNAALAQFARIAVVMSP